MRRILLAATLAATGLALAGCQAVPPAHPLPPACDLGPDAGNGQDNLTGYYYDKDSRRCQSFSHGEDAEVPFKTLELCMAACYAPAPDLMPENGENISPKADQVQ